MRCAKVTSGDFDYYLEHIADTEINGEWFSITQENGTEHIFSSKSTQKIVFSEQPDD